MSEMYGYTRVSTSKQNLARQYSSLLNAGVPKKNIFKDKKTGKNFDRDSYIKLLKVLQPGDVLIITSIDRLGRNYKAILEQWREITQNKNAHIKVLDMPLLDTTQNKNDLLDTFICDLVLQILSYLSEHIWINIKESQRQGIKVAKAQGKHLGRPKIDYPLNLNEIYNEWKKGDITAKIAIEKSGLKKSTFYKLIKNIDKGAYE